MMARPASASVKADVTRRVPAGSRLMTSVSCSRRAATSALDSTYCTCGAATPPRERMVAADRERPVVALGFATICVDQCRCCTARQADVRPILEGIAGLQGRAESPNRQEFVPATPVRLTSRLWRDQIGDDSPMRGNRNPFAGFYAAYVSAQVVLQLPDADSSHVGIMATCGLKARAPSIGSVWPFGGYSSSRSPRQLHVVAEAERERGSKSVLRERARGGAWRRRVLILRYADQSDRCRHRRVADRPEA